MKNRFLTLLTVTMLAGSILVGCGGNETGADANTGSGTNVEVNEETNKDNDDVSAKIDPNIEYTETAIAFLVSNDSDVDKSMVDGTEVPDITEDVAENSVEYKVTFKKEVNLYAKDKSIVGYLKPNVVVAFAEIKDGWAIVGSTDYTETYFLLMSEVASVIEITEDPNSAIVNEEDDTVEDTETVGMSDKAKAFFDEVRQGIAEVNARNEEIAKKYPTNVYVEVVEVDSPEGLELIALTAPTFDDENSVRAMVARMTESGYSQYYFEYLKETDTYVEFNIYAK